MIVSCGEALVDLVPDPVPGGGPMNAAVAAARLDVAAAFVGGVSDDAHGEMIWEHLVANGVDLRGCRRLSAPTARAIVEHVPELRFRFEGEGTADTLLDEVDLDVFGPGPHILHGGTLGLFRGRTAETLADVVEGHDGLVSLDPNVRPQIIDDRAQWDHFHERWLAHTSIYKGSDEDLAWIWPDASTEECVERLLERGVAAVVATKGAQGLTISTPNGSVHAAAPAVEVVDTVGAGDTIAAAILASLSEESVSTRADLERLTTDDWERFAARATAAAAITCSRPGADPPTRAELDW